MPRRRNPADARDRQVCVAMRAGDVRKLKAEAQARGMSLSAWVYCRTMASKPMPSRDAMVLAASIGRVGGLLNQLARVAHADGFSPEKFLDALAVTQALQRLLWSVR